MVDREGLDRALPRCAHRWHGPTNRRLRSPGGSPSLGAQEGVRAVPRCPRYRTVATHLASPVPAGVAAGAPAAAGPEFAMPYGAAAIAPSPVRSAAPFALAPVGAADLERRDRRTGVTSSTAIGAESKERSTLGRSTTAAPWRGLSCTACTAVCRSRRVRRPAPLAARPSPRSRVSAAPAARPAENDVAIAERR